MLLGLASMRFLDLKTGDKLLVVVAVSLIILSFLALLVFITLSAVSLVTWRVQHFWNLCFLLCAASLGGWMLFYTGQLRIGGGVFVRRNNVLLLSSLILAALISALVRFPGHQKYIAILAMGLALAAFHIAVPGLTSPTMLLRLLRNERIARDRVNFG
jgi:hypothetical protein